MLRIDIISCLPQLLSSPLQHSIMGRAQKKGLVELVIHDLKNYGLGKYRKVDDKPYGGEAGMVLRIEPIVHCIESLQQQRSYDEVIYMAPDGASFCQSMANQYALKENLIILCGHYKGIDQRVRDHFITQEISIGPYVLSGGELPAAVVVDGIVRLIPGVLNDATSALSDSFQDGVIASGVYTRPAEFRGLSVPKLLRSGHAAKIEEWRIEQSSKATEAYEKRESLS